MTRERNRSLPLPTPPRTTTVDAHLGEGLLLLNVLVHYHTALAARWSGFWEGKKEGVRQYQTSITIKGITTTHFAPSGQSPEFFRNYTHRIEAAGGRINPRSRTLTGVDLSGCQLDLMYFCHADLRMSNLTGTAAQYSYFESARMSGCIASMRHVESWKGADLSDVELKGATLRGQGWKGVHGIDLARLGQVNVKNSDLNPDWDFESGAIKAGRRRS